MMDRVKSPRAPPAVAVRLQGETGVWVFIAGDLLIFALFFATYLYYHAGQRLLFAQSQHTLSQGIGILNTLLLLTSSWFVALGVQRIRTGQRNHSAVLVVLAILCAAGFLTNKGIEWTQLILGGRTLSTNEFFMFFYMLTGIHALHVLIGIGVLAYVLVRIRGGTLSEGPDVTAIESGAVFWHLVDLLWIVLFALFYLVR
jgi:nitric oxide reductase NorE protein